MFRKNKLLICLLTLVFFFWLLLTYNNYFHWDEWDFFSIFKNSPSVFLLKSYGEHFIPLNLLNHYLLFKTFGLNYLPFQLMVLFFHVLNVLLLYTIVILETKSKRIAILAGLFFGISNVYIEDLLWSQGISNVASGFFISLSYLFFLLYLKQSKKVLLIISAVSLLISPLFNAIGVLYPFAFTAISWISVKDKQAKISSSLTYFVFGLINILVLLAVAGPKVSHSVISLNASSILGSIEFMGFGIVRGNIIRFIYPGLHLVKGAQEIKTAFFILIFVFLFIFVLIAAYSWLKNKKYRQLRLKKALSLFLLASMGYVAISLGRASFGLAQAGISRYTYESFFFLLIFLGYFINSYQEKWRYVVLISLGLFVFNLYAIFVFQYGFWGKMVTRDREFIKDTIYVLTKNETIYNFPTSGFFSILKISDFWYLVPKNKDIKFISPKLFNPNSCIYCSDAKTKQIYEKFTSEYQKKYD